MKITWREEASVTILDLNGRLAADNGAVLLRETLQDAFDRGVSKVLINMEGVDFIDSAGLGEIVRSKKTAAGVGATVKLLHIRGRVRQILVIARLMDTFEIFGDEAEAVASFS